jgi:hypothetical protein
MKREVTRLLLRTRQKGAWVNYCLVIPAMLPVVAFSLLSSGCRQQSQQTEADMPVVNWTNSVGSSNSLAATLQSNLDFQYRLGTNREPYGSRTSWLCTTNSDNEIVWHLHNDTSGSNWIVYGGPVPIPLPYAYRDADSGIIFHIARDGRHITAINPDGKVLWRRDPFADAHLEFYRTDTPQIDYVGKVDASDKPHQWIREAMMSRGITNFICINFNSSQFGAFDERTGKFIFLGQD